MTFSNIKYFSAVAGIMLASVILSCKKDKKAIEEVTTASTPPETIQEHWGYHSMLIKRVYMDEHVAIYHDENMYPSVVWPNKTMSDAWAYVKKTYGEFGPDGHLYVNLHRILPDNVESDRLSGGHPASYFDADHDYRNFVDNGLGDWTSPTGVQVGIPIHEMGHIVEGASNGVQGSPSFPIWGDSKFMEIFNYDVLLNIGMTEEAQLVYDELETRDPYEDYPGVRFKGTKWFIDWFYPIWNQHGKGALLGKYFKVLADNYPRTGNKFSRTKEMNLGEFVHFWSGAAGANLEAQARTAFKSYWNAEVEAMFKNAQEDFPGVKYPY